MIKRMRRFKGPEIRLLLSVCFCMVFFLATEPNKGCELGAESGHVEVLNKASHTVKLWIGDRGPYTCFGKGNSTKILYIKPGKHRYKWYKTGFDYSSPGKSWGMGDVLVEKDKTARITIPAD